MKAVCTFLLFTLFLLSSTSTFAGGRLLSFELVKTFEAQEMAQFWKRNHVPKMIIKAKESVDVYQLIYESKNLEGRQAVTSGLYFLPKGKKTNLPLLCYDHGTEVLQDRKITLRGEKSLCLGFATDGYAVAYPDYFGLGVSSEEQIYLNADIEAQNSVDMLIAVEELNKTLGIQLSKQLFITGYSQGGHAAMATHRLIESSYADRFPVTASSPMSGPYDVFFTVDNGKYNEYEYPAFLLMLVKSFYDTQKPDADFREALKAPFDSIIPPLLNGCHTMSEINSQLPSIPYESLTDEFVNDYNQNPNSEFKQFLRQNSVYNWNPKAPMQLCYCESDEEVNFQNSLTAYKTMKANGSNSIRLRMSGKKFKHENCALFASVYTKMFFDSFVNGGNPKGPAFKRMMLDIGKLAVKP